MDQDKLVENETTERKEILIQENRKKRKYEDNDHLKTLLKTFKLDIEIKKADHKEIERILSQNYEMIALKNLIKTVSKQQEEEENKEINVNSLRSKSMKKRKVEKKEEKIAKIEVKKERKKAIAGVTVALGQVKSHSIFSSTQISDLEGNTFTVIFPKKAENKFKLGEFIFIANPLLLKSKEVRNPFFFFDSKLFLTNER